MVGQHFWFEGIANKGIRSWNEVKVLKYKKTVVNKASDYININWGPRIHYCLYKTALRDWDTMWKSRGGIMVNGVIRHQQKHHSLILVMGCWKLPRKKLGNLKSSIALAKEHSWSWCWYWQFLLPTWLPISLPPPHLIWSSPIAEQTIYHDCFMWMNEWRT